MSDSPQSGTPAPDSALSLPGLRNDGPPPASTLSYRNPILALRGLSGQAVNNHPPNSNPRKTMSIAVQSRLQFRELSGSKRAGSIHKEVLKGLLEEPRS